MNSGSAPRVRGTAAGGVLSRWRLRFSPACAGNGRGGGARASPPSVQPRVCGERSAFLLGARPLAGSAPRVRGTVRLKLRARSHARFSPACAGNGCSGVA